MASTPDVPREGGEKSEKPPSEDNSEYPGNSQRIAVMGALFLTIFVVNLDTNIIATAIPRITDDFHSLADYGWYGSAYLLTICAFQLIMGKLYKLFPAKALFLACSALFELGSLLCGAAPNSIAFIFGRAIAGVGTAGIFSGAMVIMVHTIPLQQRPIYQALFGATFAVASVIGPLLGGAFTDHVTWRWCFYINLPIGAVSMAVTFWLVQLKNQELEPWASGWLPKVLQLDPVGNLVFIPAIVCLILALQWGGAQYAWQDAHVVVALVFAGVLLAAFVATQIWRQEKATVPPRIAKQRSIAASLFFTFFNGSAMMLALYYLPLWFQAVQGVSATNSGIRLLPVILPTILGSLVSGVIISKVGYCNPFFYLSSILMPIGAGLLATMTPDSGMAEWFGYQVILGIGIGVGSQQPMTIAQTVLPKIDVGIGTSLVMFARFLGPTIFLPVGQNIFLSALVENVRNLPNIDAETIIDGGATELRNLVSEQDLPTLLSDYNAALTHVYYLIAALSAITIIGSFFVEWKSVRSPAAQEGPMASKSSDKGSGEA
ncbi:major facilitator superfamily domain-containing protein [Stachybotrys elegans]|uniref:Major facilitator superfamily domain-containing protein n=1 Tax=Stachybotrys elegans TaxID=80388 RepID=A0A8K0T2P3_9HYPO|nr:major facilitator superfamily domain-containing protein [Stachybotrys elegans]